MQRRVGLQSPASQTSQKPVRHVITDSTVIGKISTGAFSTIDVTLKQVKEVIDLFYQGKLNELKSTNPLAQFIPAIFKNDSHLLSEFSLVFTLTIIRGILKCDRYPINIEVTESAENCTVEIKISDQQIIKTTSTKLEPTISIGITAEWLVAKNDLRGSLGPTRCYTLHESFNLLKFETSDEYSMGIKSSIMSKFGGIRVFSNCFTIGTYDIFFRLDCDCGIAVRYHNDKLLIIDGSFKSDKPDGKVKIGVSPTTIMECSMVAGVRNLEKEVVLVNVINPNCRLKYHGLCDDDMRQNGRGELIVEERNRSGEFVNTKSYIGDFAVGMCPTKGTLSFNDSSDKTLFYGRLNDKGEIVSGRLVINNKCNKSAPYGFMFIGIFSTEPEGMIVKGSLSYCHSRTSMTSEIGKIDRLCYAIGKFKQEGRKYLSKNDTTVIFYGNKLRGKFALNFAVVTNTKEGKVVNSPVNRIIVELGIGKIVWTELEALGSSKDPVCNVEFDFAESGMRFSGDFNVVKDGEVISGIICNAATAIVGANTITGRCRLIEERMIFTATNGNSYTIILNDTTEDKPTQSLPSLEIRFSFRSDDSIRKKYKGQFNKDAKFDGNGVYTEFNPDGKTTKRYIGEFKQGKFDGSGELTEFDSDEKTTKRYIGKFKQGKFDGSGALIVVLSGKQCTYKGTFEFGEIVTGTIVIAGENRTFHVESRNRRHEIIGEVVLKNNARFAAKFYGENILQTDKRLIYPDNTVYIGSFDPISGETFEKGILVDGSKKYIGIFTGGKFPAGEVTITISDKTVFEGEIDKFGKMVKGIQYCSNDATFAGTFDESEKLNSGEYKTAVYTVEGASFVVNAGIIRCNLCTITINTSGDPITLDKAVFSFDTNKNLTTIKHKGSMYSRNYDENNNEWTVVYSDGSIYTGPFKLPVVIAPAPIDSDGDNSGLGRLSDANPGLNDNSSNFVLAVNENRLRTQQCPMDKIPSHLWPRVVERFAYDSTGKMEYIHIRWGPDIHAGQVVRWIDDVSTLQSYTDLLYYPELQLYISWRRYYDAKLYQDWCYDPRTLQYTIYKYDFESQKTYYLQTNNPYKVVYGIG